MNNNYNPVAGDNAQPPKLIDTIMASQMQEDLSEVNLTQMLAKAFNGLKRKQRHVLKKRYGLAGIGVKTLQEIGDSYGVTRERIRQIEKAALRKLAKEANFKHFSPLSALVVYELEQAGGVLSEEELVERILANRFDASHANSLRLIFEVHPELYFIKEDDNRHPAWRLESVEPAKIQNIISTVVKHLNDQQEVARLSQIKELLASEGELEESFLKSVLGVAKPIMPTANGAYGLMCWSTINPKNIRDKIYFVLRKKKKPLHFMDITEMITKEDFLHKKDITHQAVHNELIADERYILIGKGIYALKEWGYTPGTVADVISTVLKEKGEPMTREEIIEEVLKRRMVKKNTIVINLHDKAKFTRNKEGKFWVKE
jgi:hypothetical protein